MHYLLTIEVNFKRIKNILLRLLRRCITRIGPAAVLENGQLPSVMATGPTCQPSITSRYMLNRLVELSVCLSDVFLRYKLRCEKLHIHIFWQLQVEDGVKQLLLMSVFWCIALKLELRGTHISTVMHAAVA